MAKRKLLIDEFNDLSSVTHTSINAKVRGVVTAVSPMKKGKTCKYFDGELADDKARIRLFGFDSNIRQKLLEHLQNKDSIIIGKCEVKHMRKGDKLEVMLAKKTEIDNCSDTFVAQEDNILCLADLNDLDKYTRVNTRVKVLNVANPQKIAEKNTQNVMVADETGCAKLTQWEQHVGCVELNKSYYSRNMLLRVYYGERYLTTAKHDSTITPTEDVNIDNATKPVGKALPNVINDVKVIAVESLSISDGCLQCGHTVTPTEEEEFGECQKCGLLQCREECKLNLSVHFTIKTSDGDRQNFYAYNEIVTKIAEKEPHEVTKIAMLKSRPFSLQHNKNNVIQSNESITRI